MPKDRRANNSSSFDRAMVSPYACSLTNYNSSSTPAGDEVEWEEARCPICIEHPHNAVLLLCSSGCRPFICDTSYRHSNCLDQYRKSSSQRDLICPLCRGRVSGWIAIEPARRYLNSKTRNCSLETCSFSGTYSELRKHARVEHPSDRPSEVSPTRQSNWRMLEQQRDIEDALGHQSDLEFDFDGWLELDIFGEDDIWSDGSFLNWRVAMSDVEDDLMDRMFSPRMIMDSTSSISMLFDQEQNGLPSPTISREGNVRSNYPSSRSSHHVETSRSRTNYYRENAFTRSSFRGESGRSSSRARSNYNNRNRRASSGAR